MLATYCDHMRFQIIYSIFFESIIQNEFISFSKSNSFHGRTTQGSVTTTDCLGLKRNHKAFDFGLALADIFDLPSSLRVKTPV